jgi:hypothetical protein
LLSGSPALGAGNPATPGSGGGACLATDQRGVDRSAHGVCDIGAYEVNGPMVVSIKRADPNPTGASLVNFTVTFSEPVTGVTTVAPFSDFALTPTGSISGASITSVSGSDAIYTVTVNTGSGAGAIRLDVLDDDTILDAATHSFPLGGPGIGNGSLSGEAYSLPAPKVLSSLRAGTNPTSAASIVFKVTFSAPVSGVDVKDFTLKSTGSISGASIIKVSGSGSVYTVTVRVGSASGNGAIHLNVVDNDSIHLTNRNTPLGGPGVGNGNYTAGQTYNIVTIPTPLLPANNITDSTPTYKWTAVPRATKYQYLLVMGATTVYSQLVTSSVCGTSSCLSTPTNKLASGAYKWRVHALVDGVWKSYSADRAFTLIVPKAGFWTGDTDFYVSSDNAYVVNYAMYINVADCDIFDLKLTYKKAIPIVSAQFQNNDTFYFYGAFNSATVSQGYVGLSSYYLPGCGYISGGPFAVTDRWKSPSQATSADAGEFTLTAVAPTSDAPSFDFHLVHP